MSSKLMHTQVDCLGYPVFGASLDQLPQKSKLLVNTINQYSYCIAKKDVDFKKALMSSDVLLPDGISMVLTAKLLHGKKLKKIAGADIHEYSQIIKLLQRLTMEFSLLTRSRTRQEKWSYLNKNKLNTDVICSIGAVFDFYAGTVQRPNEKWRNLGLEWLGRLFKEPKRMWQRYLRYGGVFCFYLLREKFRLMTGSKKTVEDVPTSSDSVA